MRAPQACVLMGLSLLVLAGLGRAQPPAETPATTPQIEPLAAPGRLVQTGDRKLHLIDQGEGSPVVVLIAGMGDFAVDWACVQAASARFARTISYDRAGDGWSDPAPGNAAVGLAGEAADLRGALEAAGAPPPYVLVGQSWGGAVARVFTAVYPDRVAGLVLVDSTHEDTLLWLNGKVVRPRLVTSEEWKGIWKVPADVKPMRMRPKPPEALQAPFDKLPQAAQKHRLWAMAGQMFRPMDFRVELERLHQSRGEEQFPLGDRPLIVLTRTLPATDEEKGWTIEQQEKDHLRLQADLASLSRNSRQVPVLSSGHHIQLDQPQAVVEAIKEVLTAVKEKKKLGASGLSPLGPTVLAVPPCS